MTLEEWREMVERIETLQRDVKEAMQEVSDLGYRVLQLEKANWPKPQEPQEPPRFQAGYGDGGKGRQ